MGNTSFILVRDAQRDELTGPSTQFAELTGAYWLEPIYARLANEWSRQGRTVPGAHSGRLRLLTDGAAEPVPPDEAERASGDTAAGEPGRRPQPRGLTLEPAPLAGVTVLPGRASRSGGDADGHDADRHGADGGREPGRPHTDPEDHGSGSGPA
ncbi:hypothetical protein H181DRAFT_03487 [Streptomyces sp. WMMB 714]|uniref:hypothetical protein n=1 Tax=Streptomyces sp. WMMB 714 TaxID=1286822 RepID=UPI0005F7DE29|nr:hypothetical protein [Streptomyces sp. WMMB 714]SCK40192.1 hypothetical protein H181DRAFT_03487 [Streptomyces sp. WMMB 714]